MYLSRDVDYVLPPSTRIAMLAEAMGSVGFNRTGDRYNHPNSRFFVEFPAGPLAIGSDLAPRPVRVRRGRVVAWSLSATDSCRDRLAAHYHWKDRQALRVALEIALRNRLLIERIRVWSKAEGCLPQFEEFQRALRRAKSRRRRR